MNHDELEKYLFQTNIPPSENDYKRARQLLRLEEEKFDLIDSLVEDLTRRRNQIDNRVHSYKNIVSAARRFPTEIVAAIFRCSIALESDRDIPSPRTAPLLLIQICSAWREIALQTQELWNYASIFVEKSSSEDRLSAQISLARDWMKRCRTLPYTLTLFMSRDNSSCLSEIISIQPKMLGTLTLYLPYDQLQQLGNLPTGMFPSLHTLNMCLNSNDQPSSDRVAGPFQLWPDTTHVFESAPRLDYVNLLFPCHSYDIWRLRLPWHQLTDLHLHRFHFKGGRTRPKETLGVLECTKCLVTCAIALDDVQFESSGVIELPYLETLDVDFGGVAATVPFFNSLYLPNLMELRFGVLPVLGDWYDDPPFPLECVKALQQRSNFDLQELAMSNLNIDTAELFDFFTLVPNLRSISLTFMHCIDSELIIALTHGDDDEILFPALTEMTLGIFLEDEDDITSYLEKMIQSRLSSDEEICYVDDDEETAGDHEQDSGDHVKNPRSIEGLKTLRLGAASARYFTEEDVARLEAFASKGLRLSIKERRPFLLQLFSLAE